jgi:hypothetical protein
MPEDDDDGTNCARMYNLNRPNPPPPTTTPRPSTTDTAQITHTTQAADWIEQEATKSPRPIGAEGIDVLAGANGGATDLESQDQRERAWRRALGQWMGPGPRAMEDLWHTRRSSP